MQNQPPKTTPIHLLPAAVQERLPQAQRYADEAMRKINAKMPPAFLKKGNERMKKILSGKMGYRKAMLELWSLVDQYGALAAPHAACRSSCTHCCHIPVALSPGEARLIGDMIGRTPSFVEPSITLKDRRSGNPCTFLKDGRCSIYAARPMACRAHYNMDSDPLLCELIDGVSVPVFYLNVSSFQQACAVLNPDGLADIRAFFPAK